MTGVWWSYPTGGAGVSKGGPEPFERGRAAGDPGPAVDRTEALRERLFGNSCSGCRHVNSLMTDDGMRRIRLFQVCDLVLSQGNGQGTDGILQMRDLRCPDDGCHDGLLL
jgi:hypothetical protein